MTKALVLMLATMYLIGALVDGALFVADHWHGHWGFATLASHAVAHALRWPLALVEGLI